MQSYTRLELAVGVFVLIGAAALGYMAFTLGDLSLGAAERYAITARFSSVGELKVGDPVKLAGVTIGEVKRVTLTDFVAQAEFAIDKGVPLPEDTIASVQSAGLLGDAYISLSPGASEKDLPDHGRITRTEPAVSLTELIAKYAFGSPVGDDKDDQAGGPAGDSGPGEKAEKASPFDDPLE